jgi:RHS repeat-associated protein
MFDLAVNGGGLLTIEYRKAGYLPVHRQVQARWQDYAWAPDVAMIPYDNQVTPVDLSLSVPIQVARGSVVADSDGTRQATLLFPQGTQAQMALPDNSTRPLTTLNVRATEFTVGPIGPSAMPAPLPPTSAYTYAVDLSVDEATAAGATGVVFDRPVYHYVENFLNFPVGIIVPVGYYDKKLGAWVPSRNGRVIKIVSITEGTADIDTNGDGAPDNAALLAAMEINDAERGQLAALYQPGQSLWRVPIPHLSPWDFNFASALSPDAVPPNGGQSYQNDNTVDPCQKQYRRDNSVIECQGQVLGESISVVGAPFFLNYGSDRVPGRKAGRTLEIPLSGPTIPGSLKRILLEIAIAGRLFTQDFVPAANLSTTFAWDGMDAYGRLLQGDQPTTIRIGFAYDALYALPPDVAASFGLSGSSILPGIYTRGERILSQVWTSTVRKLDFRAQGLGGWTPDLHHFYDPGGRVLYLGDGGSRNASDLSKVITRVAGLLEYIHYWDFYSGDGGPATLAGINYPISIAVGPDGNLYFADYYNSRVRRVGTDGIITTVAGNGVYGYSGDGGPATQAAMKSPSSVAVGPDGSLYIADYIGNRIRRVGTDNIITTVAGTGQGAFTGDGVPAIQASLFYPRGVAVGPDGSLYIAEHGGNRIRRVGADGIINTVAGNSIYYGYSGDGGFATQATLGGPWNVTVGPDGSVYFNDAYNLRIRRVGTDGIITTVAGNGSWGFSGDGGPATQASITYADGVAVAPDGSIYLTDYYTHRIRRVGPDGIITTVVGNGSPGVSRDGDPATQATLYDPRAIAIGPDDSIYIGSYFGKIFKVSFPLPGISMSDSAIASEDGKQIYIFNMDGRHLRTLNALTGSLRYQFDYDANGALVQITDADNNATIVERDFAGKPAAVVASGGQRTTLSVDSNGYLASVTSPAGDNLSLTHSNDGLLLQMIDPRGYPHDYAYDALGRLIRDDDPAGGFNTLTRTYDADGTNYVVHVGTALGRTTSYEINSSTAGITDAITTMPTGAQSIHRLVAASGVRTIWSPDNTVTEVAQGPDPRFGMQTPIDNGTTVWTPGGLVSTATVTRSAILANPDDPLSLLTQTDVTTANGRTYTTVYDNASLTTRVTSPTGRESLVRINPSGKLISVQADNAVLPTTFTYYGEGHPHKGLLYQRGQGADLWTYQYDDRKRLWKVTDPLDNTSEYGYDNADRVVSVILPSGRTYGFGYDAGGNRTNVVMPNGAVHGLGYSPVNLDNAYMPPGNPSYSHSYSLDREWLRTALPSGRSVDAAYDLVNGRLLSVTFPEGSVVYDYADTTGRVSTLARASAIDNQALDFSYDGFLTTRVSFSGAANGEFLYGYDNNFWVTGVALDNAWNLLSRNDDGLRTGDGPFTFGRGGPAGAPDNVSDLISRMCALDNVGLPASCPTGSLDLQYGYDNTSRLARRNQTVNGNPTYQVQLTRDPVGRISRKVETVAGTTATYDYTYDVDGQLIEVRKDGALVEQYSYDNNANRTSSLSATASYDEQDRLLEQGYVNYQIDVDGFLVQRGSDTFQYSARGELLQATAGGQTVTYQYDGTSRRVAKTTSVGTTQYLYGNLSNPFQVTASRAPDNVLTTYYYDDYGALYAFERGGMRFYVGSDHLGTPKVVTDNTGTIVRQIEYDSWGVRISDTNPSFDLPVGFAGGIPDDATGLVRFGLRDYEPASGRWTAKDPIFFKGGLNLFQYCGNDPVNFKDPSGQGWWSDKAWPWIRDTAWPTVKNFLWNAANAVFHPIVGALSGLLDPEGVKGFLELDNSWKANQKAYEDEAKQSGYGPENPYYGMPGVKPPPSGDNCPGQQ